MRLILPLLLIALFQGCEKAGGSDLTHKYYDIKECSQEMSTADDIDESQRIDKIVVHKSKREMELYRNSEVVDRLKVSLGKDPIGKKLKKGDNKTPEGEYWIRRKLCSQKYYRSLCISYPNEQDIQNAKAKGTEPGGDITIHAQQRWNSSGYANTHVLSKDWTEGCIAVTNESMQKLWYAVREGVPIVIKK